MNENPSTPNVVEGASAQRAVSATPKVRYAGGASLIDVMIDQFDYLLDHGNPQCGPKCADCKRLEQVKHWLLAPFSSAESAGADKARLRGQDAYGHPAACGNPQAAA